MTNYTPMAPTLVREPFLRDGWIYEEKADGWRTARAFASSSGTASITPAASTNIATAISKLSARTLVLDGEVAIYPRYMRPVRKRRPVIGCVLSA